MRGRGGGYAAAVNFGEAIPTAAVAETFSPLWYAHSLCLPSYCTPSHKWLHTSRYSYVQLQSTEQSVERESDVSNPCRRLCTYSSAITVIITLFLPPPPHSLLNPRAIRLKSMCILLFQNGRDTYNIDTHTVWLNVCLLHLLVKMFTMSVCVCGGKITMLMRHDSWRACIFPPRESYTYTQITAAQKAISAKQVLSPPRLTRIVLYYLRARRAPNCVALHQRVHHLSLPAGWPSKYFNHLEDALGVTLWTRSVNHYDKCAIILLCSCKLSSSSADKQSSSSVGLI